MKEARLRYTGEELGKLGKLADDAGIKNGDELDATIEDGAIVVRRHEPTLDEVLTARGGRRLTDEELRDNFGDIPVDPEP